MQLETISRLTRYEIRCTHEAMDYIDKYYSNYISAEGLSMEVSLSVKKLQAGIQRETGLCLHDYILKVRVEKSKPLLMDSNKPVKAIASSVGFKTTSHYGEVFKRFTNMTPSSYRSS